MNGRTIVALLVLLTPWKAFADGVALTFVTPNAACREAIVAAERAHGIPSHLLAAVARVESGRRDQISGTFNPWPWTINIDGQGSFYDTKAQAVAAATSMRPHAATSLDVGCMQISLTFHPDAFPDMNLAFDPASNADYGARFLMQLYEKTGSWPRAVEMYHSATPEIGQEYGRRVYAALPEEQRLADVSQPWATMSAWASPIGHQGLLAPLRQGAPHVIMQAPGPMGGVTPGRALDFYRSYPVRMAARTP